MNNRIQIGRGSSTANVTGGLLYGEMFWDKTKQSLFIGKPDGLTGELEIGGQRAMQSMFFKGAVAGGSLPGTPAVGDLYLINADGGGYKTNDLVIYSGVTNGWLRINNQDTSALGASAITFNPAGTGLVSTNVQAAIVELDVLKLQYTGTFDASAGSYPAVPVVGSFYLASAGGVVSGTTYLRGDAAFWNGATWTKIPFSIGFPVNGATFHNATVNAVTKFDTTTGQITSSIISDDGTVVTVAGNEHVTGNTVIDGTLKVASTTITGSASPATLALPTASGTLELTTDHKAASLIDFATAGTGITATDVQGALAELDKERLRYSGTIAVAAYPASPVIGGFYNVVVDVTIGATVYKKGDFAYYDGTTWTQIVSGYTDAADIDFINTGVVRADGSSVTEADVQAALVDIYLHKADLDGSGKVPVSQLPASIFTGMTYQGTWDATTAYPASPNKGDYYVVNVANAGLGFYVGDWIVFNGVSWDKVDNQEKITGIKVGAATLQGVPEIQANNGVAVAAASGIITLSGVDATASSKGVVQIDGGLSVAAGVVSVHTGAGIKLDGALAVAADVENGLFINGNNRIAVKTGSGLQINGTSDALELTDTGVTPGVFTKVTVDAKGRITLGDVLVAADLPIVADTTGTSLYNATTAKVASLGVVGPVAISKTGDEVVLDFTQAAATALSSKFAAVGSQTEFDWTSRGTGSSAITSLLGAANANREDLWQFVELLDTKGAAVGVAAGANLVGANGIVGVTPTGLTAGAAGTVQEVLEGLKAYTDSVAATVPTNAVLFTGTGNTGAIPVFTADNTIAVSHLSDDGTVVKSTLPLEVLTSVTIDNGAFKTVLTGSGANNSLALPATGTTLLSDASGIDGGDWG